MDELDHLKRLLGLLTQNGVTYFRQADLELRLEVPGASVPAPPAGQGDTVADPYVALVGNRARFPGPAGSQ
jgi:hypothetical protein